MCVTGQLHRTDGPTRTHKRPGWRPHKINRKRKKKEEKNRNSDAMSALRVSKLGMSVKTCHWLCTRPRMTKTKVRQNITRHHSSSFESQITMLAHVVYPAVEADSDCSSYIDTYLLDIPDSMNHKLMMNRTPTPFPKSYSREMIHFLSFEWGIKLGPARKPETMLRIS